MEYIYRVHAIERMFQRDIIESYVEEVIRTGEIIEKYENEYPSFLVIIKMSQTKQSPSLPPLKYVSIHFLFCR